MSMGAYDAAEHQRREEKASAVDASSDDERSDYEGTVEYDVADDTEDLLAQFREIKSR
ncbi:DUF5786 family protein [Halococcus thailandensis]|nr:DUF5786 family protein [Halococcus thailandensis]